MLTTNVILISKVGLEPLPALKQQLEDFSEQLSESEKNYLYQPSASFLHTFLWLLENNKVQYLVLDYFD